MRKRLSSTYRWKRNKTITVASLCVFVGRFPLGLREVQNAVVILLIRLTLLNRKDALLRPRDWVVVMLVLFVLEGGGKGDVGNYQPFAMKSFTAAMSSTASFESKDAS